MLKVFRRIMIFWCFFIGIGALWGSVAMFLAPDGSILQMQSLLVYFKVLPFSDILFTNYIFSGISLLIVNCITNLTAAVLIILNKRSGAYLGAAFGVTLMLWITIQFIIFPFNFLSTAYFIFGLLQFICGYYYIILTRQNDFLKDVSQFKNIGKNHDTVVYYFSRLGYTERIAYNTADKLGCDICEITTNERIKGFLGFAWLGRFSMHHWSMEINNPKIEPDNYKNVIIVTPVYVFTISPPIRGFCEKYKGKLHNVSYIAVHFRKDSNFTSVFSEMDSILEVKATDKKSIVCKFGKVIRSVNL